MRKKRREIQSECQHRIPRVKVESHGPEDILIQPPPQCPTIPPEEVTKATKGKGSSPNLGGTKEEEGKRLVKIKNTIGPRDRTPRPPAPKKKAIKGSTKETNSASEEEVTPRQQPVRGEGDLNEDEPAPCGNQRRMAKDAKKEGYSGKQSLPPRSKSPLIYCEFERNKRTKKAPRAHCPRPNLPPKRHVGQSPTASL